MLSLLKEKKTRRKIIFTVIAMILCLAINNIPVYGVNPTYMSLFFTGGDMLTFMNLLTGGAISHMSMGAFGISSFITASIILQLLSVPFPGIEKAKRVGEAGKKAYFIGEMAIALVMTVISSVALSVMFGRTGLLLENTPFAITLAALSWTLGTFLILMLAKQVDDKGVGSGTSLVLAMNILAGMPDNVLSYLSGIQETSGKVLAVCAMAAGLFAIVCLAVYMHRALIRVPIKQPMKRAAFNNEDGFIPVTAGVASVLPVIYASSLVSAPGMIMRIAGVKAEGVFAEILSAFQSSNWFSPKEWYHVAGFILYLALVIGFGFFASSMSFSSAEAANMCRKNGNIVPGVKPGAETEAYLEDRRKAMTWLNILFLIAATVIPGFICAATGAQALGFAGTSLLIACHVVMDTRETLMAMSMHARKEYLLFPEVSGKRKEGKRAS